MTTYSYPFKKSDIQIGGRYRAAVSGSVVTVRITGASSLGGWDAVNESTGRTIRVKSASKLRAKVTT